MTERDLIEYYEWDVDPREGICGIYLSRIIERRVYDSKQLYNSWKYAKWKFVAPLNPPHPGMTYGLMAAMSQETTLSNEEEKLLWITIAKSRYAPSDLTLSFNLKDLKFTGGKDG